MEVVLIGRDVLKTLGIDPLTQVEDLRVAKELKEITFPSDFSKCKKEKQSTEVDDEIPIADELSEVELDAALTEMIARGAKSLEPEETKSLRRQFSPVSILLKDSGDSRYMKTARKSIIWSQTWESALPPGSYKEQLTPLMLPKQGC